VRFGRPPEDALGVIARATQLVVVGDQKQLPPTTFFTTLGEDDSETPEEDITVGVKDAESILEVASRIYTPSRCGGITVHGTDP
jgi:hypothetical protein